MNILLTNDDGINSIGLKALIDECLKRNHNVFVSAPAQQMSASSHCMTLHSPVYAEDRSNNKCTMFAIHGTPVDCVRVGVLNLVDMPIDMVISGINNGYNSGRAVIYSGTVAAAREALMLGIKAVAVSIDFNASGSMLKNAAEFGLDMAERFYNMKNPPSESLLNINIPGVDVAMLKKPVMTFVGSDCPADGYDEYQSPRKQRYFHLSDTYNAPVAEEHSDYYYLCQNHIACSFISIAVDKNIICSDFLD